MKTDCGKRSLPSCPAGLKASSQIPQYHIAVIWSRLYQRNFQVRDHQEQRRSIARLLSRTQCSKESLAPLASCRKSQWKGSDSEDTAGWAEEPAVHYIVWESCRNGKGATAPVGGWLWVQPPNWENWEALLAGSMSRWPMCASWSLVASSCCPVTESSRETQEKENLGHTSRWNSHMWNHTCAIQVKIEVLLNLMLLDSVYS